jgi:sec-independent protein translocase protein TatB
VSNLGSGELLVVLLLALIVLGPDRLPEAARKIGGFVRQVRQMSSGFEQEVRKAIDFTDGDKPFHPEEARIRPLPAPTDEGEDPVTAFDTDVRGVGAEPFTVADAPAGEVEREREQPGDQRAAG